MKTNIYEKRMENAISGILSALLCVIVVWDWAPLIIAGFYFCSLLFHFTEWYFELKEQKKNAH